MLAEYKVTPPLRSNPMSWPSLIVPSLIGGTATSILSASLLHTTGLSFDIYHTLLGAVPGMGVGVLVDFILKQHRLLQEHIQALVHYQEELMVERLEREVGVIGKYVMSIINAHTKHKDDLKFLFRRSICDRIIQNVPPEEFYKLIQKILKHTEKWQAIHHGPLSVLMEGFPNPEFMERFYALFHNPALRVKQRIVILGEQEESELANQALMQHFFEVVGHHIDSYWIKERQVRQLLKQVAPLGDCALYDEEILLQYDRTKQTITFYCHTDEETKIVRTLFRELEACLQDTGIFGFQKMDRPAGGVLPLPTLNRQHRGQLVASAGEQ